MARKPKHSGKDPSFQFYWKDWLSDTRLDLISDAARGVWADLMAASNDMPVRGIFWREGRALLPKELLNFCHGTGSKLSRFRELRRHGILKQFVVNSEYPNAFYVKRIYEDMKLREVRKEAGKRGGNPNLVNQNANQNTPSSSSSSEKNKEKQPNRWHSHPQGKPDVRLYTCVGPGCRKPADEVFPDGSGGWYGLCRECIPKCRKADAG